MNPILEHMGYGESDRVVIFHLDDVGMCHGANVAFVVLSQRGLISCGSAMAPCSWFPEAAALAREHPDIDLGVHLTLNSEWANYRWRPISTADRASGMIDPDGFMWEMPATIREHARLDVAAVEKEFRAQIDTALQAGIDITHIDSHVGIAAIPELIDVYVQLALDYEAPALLIRDYERYRQEPYLGVIDPDRYEQAVDELEGQGFPVVDHFRISPLENDRGRFAEAYERLVRELPAGLTYLALHPSAPGDTEAIFPPGWAKLRTGEFRLLQDPTFQQFVAGQGIHIVGYRQLRDSMRAVRSACADRGDSGESPLGE